MAASRPLSADRPRRPAQRGLTLVEQMVVVTLVSVLVAMASPNLSAFMINNRLQGTTKAFVTVLTMARGEAVMRGRPIVLRRSGPTAQNWGPGWELFVDVDGDGARNAAPGSPEELLRWGEAVPEPFSLFSSSAAADGVRFLPNGRARALGVGEMLFIVCHEGQLAAQGQSRSRAVLVSDSGRIRVAAVDDAGQPLNDLGAAIGSCTDPA
jgi:type IV fimbrial biogenesis protein FimT